MSAVLVIGARGSVGAATCTELRERGFRVIAAGRARSSLEVELGDTVDQIIELDVTSPDSVRERLQAVTGIDALVYNCGRLDLHLLADTTPDIFIESWKVNTFGAFLCARAVLPQMLARQAGNIVFLGATASLRGGARSHAFASAKHALRGLASSLAKEHGPRGVHVAHLVIDGKIWGPRTIARFPDTKREHCLEPAAVAAVICSLIAQPRSAWTFEIDLRPAAEKWT